MPGHTGPPAEPAPLLIRVAQLDLPASATALFGREAPLCLEVGFGDGRFLATMATEHPDWNWLGADMSATYVLRAMRALRRRGIPNVRLLHGPGSFAVRYLLPRASLSAVYVNFPDPWPKSRHQSRRLLKVPFLALLSTRLLPGGRVLVTTDHGEYFRFVLDQAAESGLFAVLPGEPPEAVLGTKYASKWRSAGRPIQHAVLVRTAEAPDVYPPIARSEMPHAILSGDLPGAGRFVKQVRALPQGNVVVLDAFRSLTEDCLAFLANIREEDLEQQVLIEARPHARGTIVRLRRFGDPLVTPGVKEAVGCVADWLASQGMSVLDRVY